MNLFEKIQAIRVELREQNLKPTGKNEFAKYSYFELDDFLPQLNRLMQKYNMTAIASFTSEIASLTAIDYEVESPALSTYTITSPFSSASLKGCHEVQCVGAVETYQRRYLYQALFDIGEKDGLDATFNPSEPKAQQNRTNTYLPPNKSQNANNGVTSDDVQMTLEEARQFCFTTGKYANVPFSKLSEPNLKWIFSESKCNARTKKAAKLVYDSIQEMKKSMSGGSQLEMTPLSKEEADELPF